MPEHMAVQFFNFLCSIDNSHQLTGATNDPCGANCLTLVLSQQQFFLELATAQSVARQDQVDQAAHSIHSVTRIGPIRAG